MIPCNRNTSSCETAEAVADQTQYCEVEEGYILLPFYKFSIFFL